MWPRVLDAGGAAGVSSRNYERSDPEQVGDVNARSTRESSVSARLGAATRARLDQLRTGTHDGCGGGPRIAYMCRTVGVLQLRKAVRSTDQTGA